MWIIKPPKHGAVERSKSQRESRPSLAILGKSRRAEEAKRRKGKTSKSQKGRMFEKGLANY